MKLCSRRLLALRLLVLLGSFCLPAISQECFCRFPSGSANTSEPLWTCNNGVRQYKCLLKARHGRYSVDRGEWTDQLAAEEYCSSARASDFCDFSPAEGFSAACDDWRALPNLVVDITCPASVNCSNGIGFLAPACWLGPAANASEDKYVFVTEMPMAEIISPMANPEYVYVEPFGVFVLIEGDSILVSNYDIEKTYVYMHNPSAAQTGYWNTNPDYEYTSYPVPKSLLTNRHMLGFSGEGLIFSTHKFPPPYPSAAPQWGLLPGNEVFLQPRWDKSYLVTFGHKHWDNAGTIDGFGIAVAVSGPYVIVSSRIEQGQGQPPCAFLSCHKVFIFERAGSEWLVSDSKSSNPVVANKVIDHYQSRAGFGFLVAIDRDGTAIVGDQSANNNLYIFNRGASSWPSTTPYVFANIYPEAVTISGDFAAVKSSAQIAIYKKSAGGAWASDWTASLTLANNYLGPAFSIFDKGNGEARFVVGLHNSNRAQLYNRNGQSGTWGQPIDLLTGGTYAQNPDGFGRSVGVSGDTIVVGSNMNKVFVYTMQLAGSVTRTTAVPFVARPGGYSLHFDGKMLKTGTLLRVCMRLEEDEEDQFRDLGLSGVVQDSGMRSSHAEEL